MPDSTPEAPRDDFYSRVWAVVGQIPLGRVTTYGHIARYLGSPRASRGVGWALKAVAASERSLLEIPCHRVVNREGHLTGRRHFSTPTAMEERLEAEGVLVASGERVDLDTYLWNPSAPEAG